MCVCVEGCVCEDAITAIGCVGVSVRRDVCVCRGG